MDKMSFKQFHKKNACHIYGGWSAPRAVGPHEFAVWDKVLALPDTGAELADKGAPTSVTSQLVSGVNYTFTFMDGSTVTIYHQSWTNTLKVTKTTPTVVTSNATATVRRSQSRQQSNELWTIY